MSGFLIYSNGLPVPDDEDFTPETVAVADAVAQAYIDEVTAPDEIDFDAPSIVKAVLNEYADEIVAVFEPSTVSELGVWPPDGDAIASEFINGVEPDYEQELETWTPPPYREVIIHNDVQIFADSGEQLQWWHPQYVIRTEQDVKDAFKRLREAEKAILREEADLEIERKDFEEKKKSFEARIKPLERKRAFIEMRMSADLKPLLTDLVESGKLKKVKYIDTGYGRYSVSDVPEKIELIEKDLAIDFASLRPDLRHLVEVVHTSKIDVNAAKKLHGMFPEGYWEVHEAEKNGNFKIKTGLR